MKISIIPSDNTIVVDGDARRPTGFVYPENIHAIQWRDGAGNVEHLVGPAVAFSEFSVVEPYLAAHAAQKAIDEGDA